MSKKEEVKDYSKYTFDSQDDMIIKWAQLSAINQFVGAVFQEHSSTKADTRYSKYDKKTHAKLDSNNKPKGYKEEDYYQDRDLEKTKQSYKEVLDPISIAALELLKMFNDIHVQNVDAGKGSVEEPEKVKQPTLVTE